MSNLYLVATPIGNLADITLRAKNILAEVDFILAEDTRVTKKLLDHYEIKTKTLTWHQHSSDHDWQKIKSLLESGSSIALVTDAGTPGVSDPGGQLVAKVAQELAEVKIIPIPGASSLTAIMSVAGIALDDFLFLGFLPHKKGRQTLITEIKESKRPVIFFESVHRILKALESLADCEKKLIVGRELTKNFETIYRGQAKDILAILQKDKSQLKGEFVIIVDNYVRKK
ncbi:MAG: Ribosomal RNA small subunit methyltransferase I [Parcubacteria group bacterium GW2011_GWA2_36_10]|nr:MAG: Ribosomal RNA small subunit methyltransferase I [Parcubacteria group bacterium GW2011_GWA2_36_10]